MIIMLLIGIFGGFISGLVGIGGAIIIYPMLLLLPPLVGLPTYSAYIASGLTSSQVFFSTLSGSFKAYKNKDFSRTLVLNMGSGMIIGSILGAILANLINVQFVNMVYIIIALLALILMFIKVVPSTSHIKFNRLLLITIGGIIGLVSGIVGAGGAFIIIPVLLVIFKLPMNTVVTNSIVIAFISSVGAFIIKLLQGYIPVNSAIPLILGSILFTPLGMKIGQKIPDYIQKMIVSILIVIAIIKLIF
ncbi:sulfite exporter TauE/SafE family protein [Staphylococcus epidermidis]|uniref:sulfite exporter TauE/SafE family protein n=1 Tax=Staphylococcus epidermidis TaxID=1282 RepID=UPI0018799FA1|nr:sulfite exporter TauE/SafE family protein [Staphylococcus epidermidis]MBE7347298.1 sulfite exporter TauE/SafE family protein [Staphylococcus epidermidis]MCG1067520.1 sulfite exporter TauE/SafE family protein [Staphylococcus epidermidis]MCG1793018.1 sulfite exporter TauE/SafE family protein [Staphylococcus epidermidis]MCG1875991.1 sulfite exporter TauE/SafE family protein [Staphylococcus epidermidis]MCG1907698.1 sulfite exporter TauE/SafE family protein [Staphylococcus epidermidis]